MFTNKTNIPLPLSVWLAASGDYDFIAEPNQISATSLLKPLRMLVLERRVAEQGQVDIDDLVASKLGTAVHTAAEIAWKIRYRQALADLGMAKDFVDKVVVNPTPDLDLTGLIPVYVEQRRSKKIGKWNISGKFDFVIDGKLHDIKTTKTYAYITGNNDENYRKQGSIYAWLNPNIITNPKMEISYLFTDWSPFKALADSTYPTFRCLSKEFILDQDIELWIRDRLSTLESYLDADQTGLPKCSPDELWQSKPTYAVYKDPSKRTRATRVFDNESEALLYDATKCSGKGLVVPRPGEVKRCNYCLARPICDQAKDLELQGLLK